MCRQHPTLALAGMHARRAWLRGGGSSPPVDGHAPKLHAALGHPRGPGGPVPQPVEVAPVAVVLDARIQLVSALTVIAALRGGLVEARDLEARGARAGAACWALLSSAWGQPQLAGNAGRLKATPPHGTTEQLLGGANTVHGLRRGAHMGAAPT